jgi:hypothetical protein
MNDTVKIERPMSCRRHEDFGGRVKQDPLGNTVKVKTRVHDAEDDSARSVDAAAAPSPPRDPTHEP